VGEANELTLRPNPANRNAAIYRYHQVPLAGKRFLKPSSAIRAAKASKIP